MKNIFLLFLLLQSVASLSQKMYQIDKVFWSYSKPENYHSRIDNFVSTIKHGEEFIKQNNKLQEQSNDDKILLALAKHDSINVNMIMASYKNNSNIVKFTLKGYVDLMTDFLKTNYEKLGSDATITSKEVIIDKVKFYVIESRVYHKETNYTYWTALFISELDNKEFSITATYDNQQDKKSIETSILLSKFVTN